MPERLVDPEVFRHRLYTGSVKDIYGVEGKDPYVFEFSDRYSIFDWGEMPDPLPGKGEALAQMGDTFFRFLGDAKNWANWQIPERFPKFWRDSLTSSPTWKELRRSGLTHHSLGLVDGSGYAVALGGRANRLAVRALGRPPVKAETRDGKLVWDYAAYQSRPERVLVPLEVVFRFGAPEGSSFLGRLEEIPGYAQSFGFAEPPRAGDAFPYPIVEFFTKLEPSDRFLTREEALAVAALRPEELDDLVALTLLTALRIREVFAPLGLELWDGKLEFAFLPGAEGSSRRGFQLVDSIGPDELRLIGPGGVHFSKEFLRRIYRGGEWYAAVERAKSVANDRGQKDWKRICVEEFKQEPGRLPTEAFECARLLYPSLASALNQSLLGVPGSPELPSVPALCERLKGLA
jgi:phosphoribosylaminoimidazole-succinocarboxamide synthase